MSKNDLHDILDYAKKNEMVIDTAEDYLNSHQLIGSTKRKMKVATKLDSRKYTNFADLYTAIEKAKVVLHQDTLEILYLRSGNHLEHEEEKSKIRKLIKNKEALGITELGFSIYETFELESIENIYGNDFIFQVPFNLANTSFKGLIENRKEIEQETRFVARSIFLQGLLTVSKHEVPTNLQNIFTLKDWIRNKAEINGCSEMEICLNFVAQSGLFEAIVVGFQSLNQLKECEFTLRSQSYKEPFEYSGIPPVPKLIYDPRLW